LASHGTTFAGDQHERCIDVATDPPADSDTWDLVMWEAYFSTCDADFGDGKLIVDVVTEEGDPLPADVDLDSIVDAFDFGYADPVRDLRKARFDTLCDERWNAFGRDNLLGFSSSYADFYMTTEPAFSEDVAGRRVRALQLLGDRQDPPGAGMSEYGIQPNEMMFSWFCNADTDQLRMLGVDDVGGGYQLLPGVNFSFTGFNTDGFDAVTRVQVVVSLIPPETTTTTTVIETTTTAFETTTTVADTTTTAAATTTTPSPTTSEAFIVPPAPTTLAPVLPETGQERGTALYAALLVALGLGTTVLARRRSV